MLPLIRRGLYLTGEIGFEVKERRAPYGKRKKRGKTSKLPKTSRQKYGGQARHKNGGQAQRQNG
jgi:ribosomal protein L4